MSQKELASALGVLPSTVTRMADRLEERDLAVRRRDRADRRRSLLDVTNRGRRVVLAAPSPLTDRLRDGLSDLSHTRREQLAEAVEDLVALLGAERVDASPVLAPEDLS